MSALPPKADIRSRDQDVCFGANSRHYVRDYRMLGPPADQRSLESGIDSESQSDQRRWTGASGKLRPRVAERALGSLINTLGMLRAPCECPMLASSPYEASAWGSTRERIGWSLRERYRVSKELPPSLLALVRKLDAVEGNLLLRRMHQAPAVRGGWPDNLPLAEPAWL
jgi:hypothetical protein